MIFEHVLLYPTEGELPADAGAVPIERAVLRRAWRPSWRPRWRCRGSVADLLMPFLGGGMESATVVEWLVAPGQRVHKGDVVAVVDTRPVLIASLSADHRAGDGHRGGVFLSTLADLLRRPDEL